MTTTAHLVRAPVSRYFVTPHTCSAYPLTGIPKANSAKQLPVQHYAVFRRLALTRRATGAHMAQETVPKEIIKTCGRLPHLSWERSHMMPQSCALSCKPKQRVTDRSEEHTSELQSHVNLVCRLLLEKKKKKKLQHSRYKKKKKKKKKKK